MNSIIQLLPDAVANQIAAGEVIQRPASAVKELMENAVDSGADSITVNVRDAGRTLIQVTDNGCGMSETDARLCWERHATSKIRDANDLFAIRTKGFRGEALASIAAIAEVSLKTRRTEDELGTHIRIAASEVLSNEPISCPAGSNFQVKNLFYNIPARRKFLKSNATELRHIINEFNHVALAHPGISFSLIHNNSEIYNLPRSNFKQRIIHLYGKHLNAYLIPIESETSLVRISGFIGKPESARKSFGEQYFFVNERYIRHPFFHKAVMQAYENILPSDTIPPYFICFDIDPGKIDVNIHPTKTEVKFEDEQSIWQIFHAVVRESIGKFNLSPSLDFNREGIIDIPVMRRNMEVRPPSINLNPGFNPFEKDQKPEYQLRNNGNSPHSGWESLYVDQTLPEQKTFSVPGDKTGFGDNGVARFMQFKNRYILTPLRSGLLVIDQKRAHERILYEQFLQHSGNETVAAQQSLFPETVELNAPDYVTFTELMPEVNRLGFDIRELGNNCIVVHGLPESAKNSDIRFLVQQMIETFRSTGSLAVSDLPGRASAAAAAAAAIPYGKVLETEEMREMVDRLFACREPNFTPAGKNVMSIIYTDDFEKLLS
jgi:DNA mismatch repair protein MutL